MKETKENEDIVLVCDEVPEIRVTELLIKTKVVIKIEIDYPEDYGNKVTNYLIYLKGGQLLQKVKDP